jgi:hypothetical protein
MAYENAIRALARRIANAEAQTRRMVGHVSGREEKYTEVLLTNLEHHLHGFSEGGVSWRVITYTTDKQSGQETRTGADLVIAVDVNLDGASVSKGALIQAKVNHSAGRGVSVDSRARLRSQCSAMRQHSDRAYVFLYGDQATEVFSANDILTDAPLADLHHIGIAEFFEEMMACRAGDDRIVAHNHRDLEQVVGQMEANVGVLVKGRTR